MTNRKWNGKPAAALLLLALLMLGLVCPACAAAIPDHTNAFYVNDFSGILSEESKEHILNVNLDLRQKTGAQVVVVTMESLNGASLEEFATDMFRTYGIGDREKNNGVLLLVVTVDRQLRIEVGYGLEGAINDAKAGRILDDYVIPSLRDDLWDQGVVNGFDALIQELCREYQVEIECSAPVSYKSIAKDDDDDDPELVLWIILLILVVIIAVAARSSDSGGGSGYSSGSTRSYSSSSSGSRYSGGGGRSGGGGASRRF